MPQKAYCVKCKFSCDIDDKGAKNTHVYIKHGRAGHPFPVNLYFTTKKPTP